MAATAIPPPCRASRIASCARFDSRLSSPAIQRRAWVSSRITGLPSLVLPIVGRRNGAHDISDDLHLTRHVVEDFVLLLRSGNQFHHGLAVFGDDDGFSTPQYLVHDREALRLKLASGYLFHSMVIIL